MKLFAMVTDVNMRYKCRHCRQYFKIYNIIFHPKSENKLDVIKTGEYPFYAPPTPSKFLELLGDNQHLFYKGTLSEFRGMGIGAFTYYRRVLDNQKNKIIDKMIKVAKIIQVDQEFLKELNEARAEDGFAESVEKIKEAIPDSFKMNGYNPLTLLNTALSRGIHSKTDEECLKVAKNIRVILIKLSLRLHELSKEDRELKEAMSSISKFGSKTKTPKNTAKKK